MNTPHRRKRRNTLLLAGLVLGATLTFTAPAAFAEGPTVDQRIELSKLVRQRNTLHQKLLEHDQQAADAIKNGEHAESLHAKQMSAQDELDLIQLRVELLAARHGLAVPPLPTKEQLEAKRNEPDAAVRAFDRGRTRAVQQVRADGRRMLASLNFAPFLAQIETEG